MRRVSRRERRAPSRARGNSRQGNSRTLTCAASATEIRSSAVDDERVDALPRHRSRSGEGGSTLTTVRPSRAQDGGSLARTTDAR